MPITATNPATGEPAGHYEPTSRESLDSLVCAAQTAFERWRRASFAERAEPLKRTAGLLRERAARYAELMAREMGKPVREGRAEVEKCAWVLDYYVDSAPALLAVEPVATDARRSFVAFQPLGVVLAIMPWNFPFWQVFRFLAPALMAGNTGLLKHASNVPGCALAIEEVLREAGLPSGVWQSLLLGSDAVPELIRHRFVRAVTLTGSTLAGRAVAALAGEQLKKTVLELGGSDPYLVLEDADLDLATTALVTGRLLNAGQSCIAAKRFIVVDAIRRELEERVVAAMRQKTMGDPFDPRTDVGPMARRELRDELHDQVQQSLRLGAKLALGGVLPPGPGAFYPPTVLTNVGPGMPAYEEELFGPVAAILSARDEADAVRIANDSVFGLGAAVFTQDLARGERLASSELDAGSCFVNAFVKSDPRLPFGGVKQSGYGRELGAYGIKEFVNIKTVYVR